MIRIYLNFLKIFETILFLKRGAVLKQSTILKSKSCILRGGILSKYKLKHFRDSLKMFRKVKIELRELLKC